MRSVQAAFELYVKLNKKVQPEVLMSVQTIDDPARLGDTIVAQPADHQARRPPAAPRDRKTPRSASSVCTS